MTDCFDMTYDFYVKTKQNLIDAVEEYGIVPYFATSIPGFSLQEHCSPYVLFSDMKDCLKCQAVFHLVLVD